MKTAIILLLALLLAGCACHCPPCRYSRSIDADTIRVKVLYTEKEWCPPLLPDHQLETLPMKYDSITTPENPNLYPKESP